VHSACSATIASHSPEALGRTISQIFLELEK
jgi:hypothetical protein